MSAGRDDRVIPSKSAMPKKKRRKEKGVLSFIAPKHRKGAKALIRKLGLEFVSVERIDDESSLDRE